MAEISNNKKGSPKVDLTAMVDLAFLLITFFMLTTSLIRSKWIETLSHPPGGSASVSHLRLVQLVTLSNSKAAMFYDSDYKNYSILKTDSFENFLRIIENEKAKAEQQFGDSAVCAIVVKPMDSSNYQTLIEILDVIDSAKISTYSIRKAHEIERHFFEKENI